MLQLLNFGWMTTFTSQFESCNKIFQTFFKKQAVVLQTSRGTNFADISNINIQENHKLCIQIKILKCISWYNKK